MNHFVNLSDDALSRVFEFTGFETFLTSHLACFKSYIALSRQHSIWKLFAKTRQVDLRILPHLLCETYSAEYWNLAEIDLLPKNAELNDVCSTKLLNELKPRDAFLIWGIYALNWKEQTFVSTIDMNSQAKNKLNCNEIPWNENRIENDSFVWKANFLKYMSWVCVRGCFLSRCFERRKSGLPELKVKNNRFADFENAINSKFSVMVPPFSFIESGRWGHDLISYNENKSSHLESLAQELFVRPVKTVNNLIIQTKDRHAKQSSDQATKTSHTDNKEIYKNTMFADSTEDQRHVSPKTNLTTFSPNAIISTSTIKVQSCSWCRLHALISPSPNPSNLNISNPNLSNPFAFLHLIISKHDPHQPLQSTKSSSWSANHKYMTQSWIYPAISSYTGEPSLTRSTVNTLPRDSSNITCSDCCIVGTIAHSSSYRFQGFNVNDKSVFGAVAAFGTSDGVVFVSSFPSNIHRTQPSNSTKDTNDYHSNLHEVHFGIYSTFRVSANHHISSLQVIVNSPWNQFRNHNSHRNIEYGVFPDEPILNNTHVEELWLLVFVKNEGIRLYKEQQCWNLLFYVNGECDIFASHLSTAHFAFALQTDTSVYFTSFKSVIENLGNQASINTPEIDPSKITKIQIPSPTATPSTLEISAGAALIAKRFLVHPSIIQTLTSYRWAVIRFATIHIFDVFTHDNPEKAIPIATLCGHRDPIYMTNFDGIRRLITIDTNEAIIWDMKRFKKLFSSHFRDYNKTWVKADNVVDSPSLDNLSDDNEDQIVGLNSSLDTIRKSVNSQPKLNAIQKSQINGALTKCNEIKCNEIKSSELTSLPTPSSSLPCHEIGTESRAGLGSSDSSTKVDCNIRRVDGVVSSSSGSRVDGVVSSSNSRVDGVVSSSNSRVDGVVCSSRRVDGVVSSSSNSRVEGVVSSSNSRVDGAVSSSNSRVDGVVSSSSRVEEAMGNLEKEYPSLGGESSSVQLVDNNSMWNKNHKINESQWNNNPKFPLVCEMRGYGLSADDVSLYSLPESVQMEMIENMIHQDQIMSQSKESPNQMGDDTSFLGHVSSRYDDQKMAIDCCIDQLRNAGITTDVSFGTNEDFMTAQIIAYQEAQSCRKPLPRDSCRMGVLEHPVEGDNEDVWVGKLTRSKKKKKKFIRRSNTSHMGRGTRGQYYEHIFAVRISYSRLNVIQFHNSVHTSNVLN